MFILDCSLFAVSTTVIFLHLSNILHIYVVEAWHRFQMTFRTLNLPWKRKENGHLLEVGSAQHLWNWLQETKNSLLLMTLGVVTVICCEYWRNIVSDIIWFQVRLIKYGIIISMLLSVNIASVSANGVELLSIPSVSRSVCVSIWRSVCPERVLWQNGLLDPDAIWDGELSRRGMRLLDGGPCAPRGMGSFGDFHPIGLNGIFTVYLKQKCIRLMHEKLTIFPYKQCIFGISISLAFRKYSQVLGQWWGLQEICKNVTPISHSSYIH